MPTNHTIIKFLSTQVHNQITIVIPVQSYYSSNILYHESVTRLRSEQRPFTSTVYIHAYLPATLLTSSGISVTLKVITKQLGKRTPLTRVIIIITTTITVIAVFRTFEFRETVDQPRLKVVAICYYYVTALFIKRHVPVSDGQDTIFRIFYAFHGPGRH